MEKVLVILGPTATGKTDLALELAKRLNGELVSVDSRQLYQGLDIGTGKFPGDKVSFEKHDAYWIMDGVKVWMYDLVDPMVQFNVKDYIDKSVKVIKDILKQNKLPILVGGTGFYLKGLLKGYDSLSTPINLVLRAQLEKLTTAELQTELKKNSLKKFENLNNSDKNNPRRLIRAIELDSTKSTQFNSSTSSLESDKDFLIIGLSSPRDVLNKRIDLRLKKRIESGMIEEAKTLEKNGLTLKRMKELGLEYSYLADFLANKIDKVQLYEGLRIKIHQFAKRQMTWFRREKDINWLDITDKDYQKKVERLVFDWYNGRGKL